MKRRAISISSAIFALTFIFAGVVSAQTKQPQPSLKETLEWMQSTLGGNGDEHVAGETRSVRLADFSECRVHFTYTTTKDGKEPYRADYSFNLADVDPSSVVFHPYPGHIREGFGNFSGGIQNGSEKIKIHQGNMSNFTLSGITFDMNIGYGVRFTKAFEHAVNLCGGKSSITAFDPNAPYSDGPAASHPALESKQHSPSQSAPSQMDIPTLAKAASGAIVSIIMSDKDGQPIAQGSGFLISNDGMVLTNYHVIAEGSSAVVKFPDGTAFPVDGVLAGGKVRDLAVIKIHGKTFRTVTLGNSDLVQVGEEVVAIGNPLSLESTVSNGIISGLRTSEEKGGKFLQTTAPISPGSSGGPLFNMVGDVIGVNSLYLEGGENLNFAIPINDAKHLLLNKFSKIQSLPNETEAVKAPSDNGSAPSSGASPPAQTVQTNVTPTMDQQVACRTQANIILQEERQQWATSGNSILLSTVNSRVDASTGICYARTDFIVGNKRPNEKRDGVSISTTVQDAIGGTIYASYLWLNLEGKQAWEIPSPVMCVVLHAPCRTEDDFMARIRKSFGL